MSIEDFLITKLIEETCVESVEKNESVTILDLRKYFEIRLNEVDFNSISDYLDQHHLSHQPLLFETKTGCYRLNFKQSVLDIPSNWSIFKDISSSDYIYIDQANDHDFLLDIFSEICGSTQNIAVVCANQKILLIFLPEENSVEHICWIKNYFDKNKITNSTANNTLAA